MTTRRDVGKTAESLATKKLKECGYKIIARNWRCRYGELDCAALKDGCLAIIEVKSGEGELPYEKIDRRKQRRLKLLAEMFADSRGLTGLPVRFDAAIVNLANKHVEILENAF